ncbi:metallo-beta-lactamase superfamily protein [Plenodomus tracheiphilus IPT5]|uniref:Metallo-beta-lactamase superfamily protein n=1 Tax=Plenodomus tracheiphilus IPT5 TaxID=1408161 RepID=A0A6A7AVJ3_9PLEO|nr:metallo-beta-lactamase superfamily protein [Plenodomus tracheiphilus IPT5]
MSTISVASDDKGGYRQINKALNICAFEDYLKGQTASLQPIPDVEEVTSRVLRVRGQNPGRFTFQGTNTFLVGTGPSRILIDTSGGEPEYAKLLASVLESRNISIKYVLLTHWHGDHSGGVPDLLQLYPALEDHIFKNDPEPGQQNIVDGQSFSVEGATVIAVHTPGHSEDHMCFILKEEESMFTGDNILGTGTSAVEDLGVFMSSLRKMKNLNCKAGHPGHGDTIKDVNMKIGKELISKLRREQQVIEAMQGMHERGEKRMTVRDIVDSIYGGSVDETTRTLALEPFIDEVLRKIAGDGKVGFEKRAGRKRWFLVPDKKLGGHMGYTEKAFFEAEPYWTVAV